MRLNLNAGMVFDEIGTVAWMGKPCIKNSLSEELEMQDSCSVVKLGNNMIVLFTVNNNRSEIHCVDSDQVYF